MRRQERYTEPAESMLHILDNWQADIYTAMPGIVVDIDFSKCPNLTVQPAINRLFTDQLTGEQQWTKMPLLLDVPLLMIGGGGMTLTMPVAVGDECLVLFADRCIDAWYQSGCPVSNGQINTQNQAAFRMHDLSDGFALVGLRSLPRILSGYSQTSMQLRSDDGNCVIDMNPTTHNIEMTCPTLTINGNLTVTGDATINGRDFMTHEHSGVQAGSDNSGAVV